LFRLPQMQAARPKDKVRQSFMVVPVSGEPTQSSGCIRAASEAQRTGTGANEFILMTKEEIRRFFESFEIVGEHWLWKGGRSSDYGRFVIGGVQFLAHRVSYQLAFGPIPSNILVCHKCDIPPCIKPVHLFLGDHRDNALDAARKGAWNGEKWRLEFGKIQSLLEDNERFPFLTFKELSLKHGISARIVRQLCKEAGPRCNVVF